MQQLNVESEWGLSFNVGF